MDMLIDTIDNPGSSILQAGETLYQEILAVASGKKTKAELLNYGNFPNIFTIGPVI
jgi:altronate dehydratase large subunit